MVLRQLDQRQGLMILLVEQSLKFIAQLGQRVLLIRKGTILRDLQPAGLRPADARRVRRHGHRRRITTYS